MSGEIRRKLISLANELGFHAVVEESVFIATTEHIQRYDLTEFGGDTVSFMKGNKYISINLDSTGIKNVELYSDAKLVVVRLHAGFTVRIEGRKE